MARHFENWLEAYVKYASFTESPGFMHYWAGVGAIGAVLGRRSWIDMIEFQWFPNFYIIFVGPPDIVRKTTTTGIAEKMLREVECVKFGPTIATWQSLITDLSEAMDFVDLPNGDQQTINAMSIVSSELGNFLDPSDKKAIDALVTLWDGGRIVKSTKNNGKEYMDHTLLNLMGCTTPSWIMGSVPAYLAEGGLFSRMLFIYADHRERRVAYPSQTARSDAPEMRRKLIEDLQDMSSITGPMIMSPEAIEWGTEWYNKLCDQQESNADVDILARKQVQLHKVAMILAASTASISKGRYIITAPILEEASTKLDEIQSHRCFVFDKIGKSQDAVKSDLVLNQIRKKKEASVLDIYRALRKDIPKTTEFEQIMASLEAAKFVKRTVKNGAWYVCAVDTDKK